MLIDTHAHYDDPAYADDLDEVLAECRGAGVGVIVNAATDLASLARNKLLTGQYDMLYAAAGIHPEHAMEYGGYVRDGVVSSAPEAERRAKEAREAAAAEQRRLEAEKAAQQESGERGVPPWIPPGDPAYEEFLKEHPELKDAPDNPAEAPKKPDGSASGPDEKQ